MVPFSDTEIGQLAYDGNAEGLLMCTFGSGLVG